MNRSPATLILLTLVILAPVWGPGLAQSSPHPSGPVQQHTDAGPDLAVTSLEIIGPDPLWRQGTPTDTRLEVVVENRGQATATGFSLSYTWHTDTGEQPLNEDAARSTDASQSSLEPGGNVTLRAPWRLQPEQRGRGMVQATASTAGDDHPANDRGNLTLFVPDHQLSAQLEGSPMVLHPDETGFYRISLNNTGNTAESVHLEIANLTGDNRSLFDARVIPETLTVPPEANLTTSLYVTFDFVGDTTPAATDYTVLANTSSGIRLKNTTPEITNAFDEINGSRQHDLTGPNDTRFVPPGDATRVHLRLENRGNLSDVYRSTVVDHPPGWNVTRSWTHAGLEPGEHANLSLLVEPPVDALPGPREHLRVNVTSLNTVTNTSVDVPVQIRGPAPTISRATVAPDRVYAGQDAAVRLELVNSGDQPTPADTQLQMHVTTTDGREHNRTQAVTPLPPGDSSSLTFSFDPGSSEGRAHVEIAWIDVAAGRVLDTVAADPVVLVPRLLVTAPPALTGLPGESLRYTVPPYTFTVENRANHTEQVHLTIDSAWGNASLPGNATLTLAPGDTAQVAALHDLPPQPVPGNAATLLLHVDLATHPGFGWDAAVDSRLANATAPRLTLNQAPPDHATSAATVRLEACLEGGNATTTVLVRHTFPNQTTTDDPLEDAGEGCWLYAKRWSAVGSHVLTVQARNASAVVAEEGPLEVQVRPAPFIGLSATATVDPRGGNGSLVHVGVQSPANISSISYRILNATGAEVAEGPVMLEDGNASLPIPTLDPGTYRFVATALGPGKATEIAEANVTIPGPGAGPGGPAASSDGSLLELPVAWIPTTILSFLATAVLAARGPRSNR